MAFSNSIFCTHLLRCAVKRPEYRKIILNHLTQHLCRTNFRSEFNVVPTPQRAAQGEP